MKIPKGIPLKSEELFKLAMTHRSAATDSVAESYERLEFFGDSVLGLIIAHYLYEHHPSWDQGMLSKAKSYVVQEAPLAETATKLGLGEFLILSASEEFTGGRQRPSILADVFEALIGGIFLESGLEKARWFVLEQLHPFLETISGGDVNPTDFKSRLQEIVQSRWRTMPYYRLTDDSGSSHERRFAVSVIVDNEVLGIGIGRSKKEAEQSAAKDAIELIERAQHNESFAFEDY
ncbi:MAG: ribonuclease III [Armatimonadetes bacterium]|nr:ribonuclease III [Armatimonadota bacterium]